MTANLDDAGRALNSTALRVHWWERARWKVRQGDVVINQLSCELQQVFAGQGLSEVTVYDVFLGYNQDERRRIVLAVLATAAGNADSSGYCAPPQSSLIKIGLRTEVERDFIGWSQTLARKGIVSRLLSPVWHVALPVQVEQPERFAVVYQDTYQLYDTSDHGNVPITLEQAAKLVIETGHPEPRSLERVLVELYSEMFRCFYRFATDQDTEPVARFYREELDKGFRSGNGESAWQRWTQDPGLQELRRDAIWLSTATRNPSSTHLPLYLDPVDYFRSVLMNGGNARIPATLFGPGHGDLHGRNVIVGIVRNEAFQPAVFDYGDMTLQNLPVWDFVKLEMELKCRLLPDICSSKASYEKLRQYVESTLVDMPTDSGRPVVNTSSRSHSAEEGDAAVRVRNLETALLFERALTTLTRRIDGRARAEKRISDEDQSPTGHDIVDRALCLIWTLRKEAACWLGIKLERFRLWTDEYYFALAAYGLLTAKWYVDGPHQAWALMSSGVAITQLNHVGHAKTGLTVRLMNPEPSPSEGSDESHLLPLALGAKLANDSPSRIEESVKVLRKALVDFPHAVSLRTELALSLARSSEHESARDAVKDLRPFCRIFRDHEMLSRLGRVYKDLGDSAWQLNRPSLREFVDSKHSGYQRYGQALDCYRDAFEFSGHFYPAINAATMALLHGRPDESRQLAEKVREICATLRPTEDEQLWVFATEGEACLLLGQAKESFSFYQSAFLLPQCNAHHARESIFHQLCRLYWALGSRLVSPVIREMKKCGMVRADMRSLAFYARDSADRSKSNNRANAVQNSLVVKSLDFRG